MFRWILLLTLVTAASASMIFPCPFPMCETLTIPNMENSTLEYELEPFNSGVWRRVTFNCYLSPDNSPCDYVPPKLNCYASGCASVVPDNTMLKHVRMGGVVTSLYHLSMAERLQQYPNLPMHIHRLQDITINYTLQECLNCPTCDLKTWHNVKLSQVISVLVAAGSLMIIYLYIQSNPYWWCGVVFSLVSILIAAIANVVYHQIFSPCSVTAPFN